MKRLLLLPIAAVLLTTPAWADDPAPAPTADERAQLFQRDRALIQALVQGGLRLAAEERALGRAASGREDAAIEHSASGLESAPPRMGDGHKRLAQSCAHQRTRTTDARA